MSTMSGELEPGRIGRTGANDKDHLLLLPLYQQVQMRVHKGQPRASPPMTQKPWLDVLKLKVPFEEDVIFEEDHRCGDVVCHPPKLLDRVFLAFGEGIRGVKGDFEAEDRIWELRLSRRRTWSVENFSWHVDIDVVGREETCGGELRPKGLQSQLLWLIFLDWNRVTTSSP